jgi:hypothetical protein
MSTVAVHYKGTVRHPAEASRHDVRSSPGTSCTLHVLSANPLRDSCAARRAVAGSKSANGCVRPYLLVLKAVVPNRPLVSPHRLSHTHALYSDSSIVANLPSILVSRSAVSHPKARTRASARDSALVTLYSGSFRCSLCASASRRREARHQLPAPSSNQLRYQG